MGGNAPPVPVGVVGLLENPEPPWNEHTEVNGESMMNVLKVSSPKTEWEKKNYTSQWPPLTIWFQTLFKISSLCSAEDRNSYRFGTT